MKYKRIYGRSNWGYYRLQQLRSRKPKFKPRRTTPRKPNQVKLLEVSHV